GPCLAASITGAALALPPHLAGPAGPPGPPTARALGIVAAVAEWRRAAGADPLRSALVAPLLLCKPLPEGRHDLVPGTERLDRFHLLGRQVELGDLFEPFLGDGLGRVLHLRKHALEHPAKDAVEAVEHGLVVDED